MRGFSGETANGTWDKVEIELTDVDLENIKRQYFVHEDITIEQSFQLLELFTEILLTAEIGIRFKNNVSEQMNKLLDDRAALIKKIQGS